MKLTKSSREPTLKERAALTRIYGDEIHWLGKATEASKIRRAKNRTEQGRNTID